MGRKRRKQNCQARGLNWVTSAIVRGNTVYLERAASALHGYDPIDEGLLHYRSSLGWEHINLTGDYLRRSDTGASSGRYGRCNRLSVRFFSVF